MARDDPPRKSGRKFAALRATFSRTTSVAELPARAIVKDTEQQSTPPQVSQQTSVSEHRQSKYTLFDLFSKPKVQTARGHHESVIDTVPEISPVSQTHPLPRSEKSKKPVVDVVIEEKSSTYIADTPAVPTRKGSQNDATKHEVLEEYWEAPPLFQAYPQSVKHGILQGPSLSIEALARVAQMRKQTGTFGSATALSFVGEEGNISQDSSRTPSKRSSTNNDTPELVEKIFVLVTAGRLVQYAGDGNYDRMPERVLQLGEKSAAFACDLIPGKHFVVQVVQNVGTDGGIQINKSRSILSRLRMPAASRRGATSFLLVFGSAEDMDIWLKAIRSVIEQFGGAKKEDDGEARVVKKAVAPTETTLSHRYRVSRPPSMISTVNSVYKPGPKSPYSRPKSPESPSSPLDATVPAVFNGTFLSISSTPEESPRDSRFPREIQSLPRIATASSSLETSLTSSDLYDSRNSAVSAQTSQTSETEAFTASTSKSSSGPPSPSAESSIEGQTSNRTTPVPKSYVASTTDSKEAAPRSTINVAHNESVRNMEWTGQENPTQSHHSVEQSTSEGHSQILETPKSKTRELYSYSLPAKIQGTKRQRPFRASSGSAELWLANPRPDSAIDTSTRTIVPKRSLSRMDSTSRPERPLSRMLPVRPSEPSHNRQTSHSRYSSSLPTGMVGQLPTRNSSMTRQDLAIAPPVSSNSPEAPHSVVTRPSPQQRTPSFSRTPETRPHSQSGLSQMTPQSRALRRPNSLQIRSDPAPFLSQRFSSSSAKAQIQAAPMASSRQSAAIPTSNVPLPRSNSDDAIRPLQAADHAALADTAGGIPTLDALRIFVAASTAAASFGASLSTSTPAPIHPPAAAEDMAHAAPPVPAMNPDRPAVQNQASMPMKGMPGLPPPPPPPLIPLPKPPPSIPLPQPPSMPSHSHLCA